MRCPLTGFEQAIVRFPSEIQVHCANSVHTEIGSIPPPLMPWEKKGHRKSRCAALTIKESELGRNVYLYVLGKNLLCMKENKRDFSFSELVWSVKSWEKEVFLFYWALATKYFFLWLNRYPEASIEATSLNHKGFYKRRQPIYINSRGDTDGTEPEVTTSMSQKMRPKNIT